LQKKSCTQQIESKLSLRSFAFSLQKKSCISAKYSSKLDILHSICIFFAEDEYPIYLQQKNIHTIYRQINDYTIYQQIKKKLL